MPLSSNLLEPIAGENPAGANLRYEPVYSQIKLARTEEDDVPQGEWQTERKTADYSQVIKLATQALAEQGKDLQIAGWLTEALLHREGFGGLREGLQLIQDLLEQFWDTVYPEIEDDDLGMRAAPLEWVGQYLDMPVRFAPIDQRGHNLVEYKESRLVPTEADAQSDSDKEESRKKAVDQGKLTPEEFEEGFTATSKAWYKQLVADIDGSLALVKSLDTLGDEKFGGDAPSYSKLRDALQDVRLTAGQLLAKKLELDPDPVELEPTPDLTAEGLAGEAGPGGATEAGGISPTPRNREDAASRIAAAAQYLRQTTPTDPASYLMLRGFRWGELRAHGTELDPKLLAAPPTEIRTRLKGLVLDGQWPQLLEVAEGVMATPFGRGWLDLQRYVLTACDGLGSDYEYVVGAIQGALRALLQDLPQLPELTLMDDSPTANAETRRWLRDQRLLEAAPAAAGGDGDDEVAVQPRHGPYQRAMDRLRSGQPDKAVEILMREAAQEKSERARFLRRSQAAHIMVDAGLEAVAMPILEEMAEQIEKHGLEEWEDGQTVAQPLGLLYRCLGKMGGDASAAQSLYLRVCRLDPMQAIHFAATSSDAGSGG